MNVLSLDDEIETRKVVNKAVRKVVNEDMSYFCGVDGISDYFYYENQVLNTFRVNGKFSPQLSPKLIELTVKEFNGYPYEEYGWTRDDIINKIKKYIEEEICRTQIKTT